MGNTFANMATFQGLPKYKELVNSRFYNSLKSEYKKYFPGTQLGDADIFTGFDIWLGKKGIDKVKFYRNLKDKKHIESKERVGEYLLIHVQDLLFKIISKAIYVKSELDISKLPKSMIRLNDSIRRLLLKPYLNEDVISFINANSNGNEIEHIFYRIYTDKLILTPKGKYIDINSVPVLVTINVYNIVKDIVSDVMGNIAVNVPEVINVLTLMIIDKSKTLTEIRGVSRQEDVDNIIESLNRTYRRIVEQAIYDGYNDSSSTVLSSSVVQERVLRPDVIALLSVFQGPERYEYDGCMCKNKGASMSIINFIFLGLLLILLVIILSRSNGKFKL